MSTIEAVIIGLIVLSTLIVIRSLVELKMVIEGGLQTLDQNLAAAIQETIQKLPIGDFEQPTAIQQAIAQFLISRVQSSPMEIPRQANGQFTVIEPDQS
tara:strand:- start:1016 stop:1312 length:297 start_codon:yes stop_codon:yes gene_type:complete